MRQRLTLLKVSRITVRNGGVLLKAFAVVLALFLLAEVSTSAYGNSDTTRTPIKHLIILMMENHSFDNLFGQYGNTSSGGIAGGVTLPYNLITQQASQGLTAVSPGYFSTADPYEGYYNYHQDWNNGQMNGFLNGSGPSSLYYFTADQMALQWAIAQNYAIGDMYFSSTLSETIPNRLYSLAGYTPVQQDQSPPPYIPYDKTIFSELDSYGVSWGYYFLNPSKSMTPLNFISGIGSEESNIGTWQDFQNSVRSATLPSVTWVSPIGGGAQYYSQHPPDNVLIGEVWLFNVIEMLMNSRLWNSSAIFVTYDEGGGYFDQVSPPTVSSTQLGFRVPFMVISPYAKEDYVSHTILSHTSILGFIDYNWEMPPLNQLVANSNLPLDVFNFNAVYPDGHITRGPYQFNSSFRRFLMSGLDFNVSLVESNQSIGDLFPTSFQYSLSSLGYPLQGESHFNLSQISSSYYTQTVKSFPATIEIAASLSAIPAVITGTLVYAHFRRKKNKQR